MTLTFQARTALIDGVVVNQGGAAEGLLLNSRMVQATVNMVDQAPNWDAAANTNNFIAQLANYRAHGLNACTVNFQGGVYRRSFGESYDAGGWNANGSAKAAHQTRLISVIEAMIAQGMVPIVGLFYFRQDQILTDEAAVLAAVGNAKTFLAPYKGSIIVEVINESSHSLVNHAILQTARVREIVNDLVADGFYASFSMTPGSIPSVTQLGNASVVFLHGNNRTPSQITDMVNTAKARFPGLPVIFNEDGPSDANTSYTAAAYLANMNAAVSAGAGWGYYDQSGFQEACSSADSGSWQCAAPNTTATGITWSLTTNVKNQVFDGFAALALGGGGGGVGEGVYQEASGVVVMEVESAANPPGGHWEFRTSSPGFFGTGYYRWIGPLRTGAPGTDSTLLYRFNITTVGGRWWIGLHSRRFGTGAGDAHNDIWMKVNADPWHKYWQRLGQHEVWQTDHRFEIGGVNVDPISGLNGVPALNVGVNEIRIEGRTADFQIDRLVLVHDPAGAPTLPLMQSHLSDPESSTTAGNIISYVITEGLSVADVGGGLGGTYDADPVPIRDSVVWSTPSGALGVRDSLPIVDSGLATVSGISGDPVPIVDSVVWTITRELSPRPTDPLPIAESGVWSVSGDFDRLPITDSVVYTLTPGVVTPPIPLPSPPAVTYSAVVVARRPAASGAPTFVEQGPLLGWSGLSWEEALNGEEAQASITVDPHAQTPAVQERLVDLVDASELWIYRGSTIVFAGPIIVAQPQRAEAGLVTTLYVPSLWEYPRRWWIEPEEGAPGLALSHIDFDQLDIVRSLIDYYQALSFGHVGLTVTPGILSGVSRDRVYVAAENHNIGQRIEELSAVADGFDFKVNPHTRVIELGYPQLGSDRTGTVVLDRRNVTDPGAIMSVGHDDLASHAHAVSPNPAGPLVTTRSNPDVLTRFGRMGVFASFNDITRQTTLNAHADRMLSDRDEMFYRPGPELIPVSGADVDDFTVGDRIEMVYDYGFSTLVTQRRVTRRRITVSETGDESISVEFGSGTQSTIKTLRDLARRVAELEARI